MDRDYLIIVSGLPRSGTSLLMQMLEAGGIPILQDSVRLPDEHNPYGYFEYEPIKNLNIIRDISYLKKYKGYAVKIVSPLLIKMTISFPARVIFLKRPLPEVILSQQKMIKEKKDKNFSLINSSYLLRIFEKHTYQIMDSLFQNPHLKVLEIHFPEVFSNPKYIIDSINTFLDENLNTNNMYTVIKPELYHNKISGAT
ncbi:MAG: hypothetical protein ACP5UA_10815 [Candidatus Hydrogenedens sp.]